MKIKTIECLRQLVLYAKLNRLIEGEPKPMLGQEVSWVPRDQLRTLKFPEADAELIQRLGG